MEVNEEKRKKFMEFAGKRVNNVMHDIQILEPMARSNAYDFTKEDVEKMFYAMQESLNSTKAEFEKKFDGTFQSLRELNHPVFACGDDCIDQISTWKEPKILLSENRFLVFSRNHSIDELKKIVNEDELLKSYSDHFEFVNLQLSNISSTNFRNLKSYEQLNEEVAEYIKKNNLYK